MGDLGNRTQTDLSSCILLSRQQQILLSRQQQIVDMAFIFRADYFPQQALEDGSIFPQYLELYFLGDAPAEPSVFVEGEQADKVWNYLIAIKEANHL